MPKEYFHSVEDEDKITLKGILEESKDMALISVTVHATLGKSCEEPIPALVSSPRNEGVGLPDNFYFSKSAIP